MRSIILSMALACSALLQAQTAGLWHVVRSLPQKHFRQTVPPGNYSGITRLRDDVYAMVSDKSDSALYFNVRLYISRQTGELLQAEWLGGQGKVEQGGLDNEAITRVSDRSVVIASEGKCRLMEYTTDGNAGRWGWSMPATEFYDNYNFESAAYDSTRNCVWTVSESTMRRDGKPASPQNPHCNVLRLLRLAWPEPAAQPTASYLYKMDMPTTMKAADTYAMGVSELCALPDGRLLVLEREAFVPKIKIGAFCQCKLYVVDPAAATAYPPDKAVEADAPYIDKRLLTSWRTSLTLFNQTWANYEGMCLGPQLENGDQVLVLVSDSQDGYAGVLRDWFKTIVISDK